jgi:hypothetical protein
VDVQRNRNEVGHWISGRFDWLPTTRRGSVSPEAFCWKR